MEYHFFYHLQPLKKCHFIFRHPVSCNCVIDWQKAYVYLIKVNFFQVQYVLKKNLQFFFAKFICQLQLPLKFEFLCLSLLESKSQFFNFHQNKNWIVMKSVLFNWLRGISHDIFILMLFCLLSWQKFKNVAGKQENINFANKNWRFFDSWNTEGP